MPEAKQPKENAAARGFLRLAYLTSLVFVALRADEIISWPWWTLLLPLPIVFAFLVFAALVAAVNE